MKIHIATDHAGYKMKEELKRFLSDMNCEVVDHGATSFNKDDDYPDFIARAAQAVAVDTDSLGIVLGGSGQGEAIVANKVFGIRAVVYYGKVSRDDGEMCADIVTLSRQHNDANILSLGARFLSIDEAKKAVMCWVHTPFSGEARHMRRIEKIEQKDQ